MTAPQAAATLKRWHELALSRDHEGLAELLTEDCAFLSPVVHTPQRGRDLTVLYLTGAMHVFDDSFHYTKEVVSADHAMLEQLKTAG